MAYTASALAFLLADLPKPVVLTGAQIPLCEYSSDATNNFRGALLSAGMKDLPGESGGSLFSFVFGRKDYQEESSLD
jgi:L-asparaginase/Glu-tRNA(Gln) amidotransferase subunit D